MSGNKAASGLAALSAVLLAAASARAIDVTYYDPAKKQDVVLKNVEITDEGPRGITVKQPGGKEVKISALDVRDVYLTTGDIKGYDYIAFRKPFVPVDIAMLPKTSEADRRARLKESLPEFDKLLKDLPENFPWRRHARYVQAQAAFRLSRLEPEFRDEAAKYLEQFRRDFPRHWQAAPTLMMLAQLHEAQGDLTKVQQTYEALAKLPGISDETRRTSLLNSARALMRGDRFGPAESQLAELKKSLPADDPQAAQVNVYLARCQALGDDPARAKKGETALRVLAGKSSDHALKAVAHNTLGDYYRKTKRPEDAFWEYLRVDVLYNQDAHEHAKALYHLSELFGSVKQDGDRARECVERLKDQRFAGLEYQKKVAEK